MELSSSITSGLLSLNKLAAKEELPRLCSLFIDALLNRTTLLPDDKLDHHLYALSSLLIEGARCRYDSEKIRMNLVDIGVNDGIAKTISDIYQKHEASIFQHMEGIGFSTPTIVDIDWRLDYSIQSASTGRDNSPVFFVALKVIDRGVPRTIDMVASIEQLQDLFSKVRDAVKQVDRVLSATENS